MKHALGCCCNVCRSSSELQTHLSLNEHLQKSTADNDVETPSKIALPTASKTDRFLGCQWWVGRPVTDSEVGHEALYGSAFHEVMAGIDVKRACAKFGVEADAESIRARAKAADAVLKTWLFGGNPWSLRFDAWRLSKETSIAYNIESGMARSCANPTDEGHDYADREEDEIPGTVDLLGIGSTQKFARLKKPTPKIDAVLVLDHKSGFDIGSPHESGQLLTLALAACRLHRVDKAFIAFLHAPGHMEPTVYADVVDAGGLLMHAEALLKAHRSVGGGSLRPDYYCKWCQAFSACPTNAGALVELRGKRALQTAEDVGAAHQKLAEMRKRFAALESQVDSEIRAWITKNGSAVCPDGREVDFVGRNFTNLSQTSIIRALGELKGRREIERLRRLGCIEEGERKELRVK